MAIILRFVRRLPMSAGSGARNGACGQALNKPQDILNWSVPVRTNTEEVGERPCFAPMQNPSPAASYLSRWPSAQRQPARACDGFVAQELLVIVQIAIEGLDAAFDDQPELIAHRAQQGPVFPQRKRCSIGCGHVAMWRIGVREACCI
jgi:hypothetical protein